MRTQSLGRRGVEQIRFERLKTNTCNMQTIDITNTTRREHHSCESRHQKSKEPLDAKTLNHSQSHTRQNACFVRCLLTSCISTLFAGVCVEVGQHKKAQARRSYLTLQAHVVGDVARQSDVFRSRDAVHCLNTIAWAAAGREKNALSTHMHTQTSQYHSAWPTLYMHNTTRINVSSHKRDQCTTRSM